MPFAAALSEHPIAAEAAGEVLGRIVEIGGVEPDMVVVFASAAHGQFMGEISAVARALLRPRCLIGSAAGAVLACRHESEVGPALAVWAAWTGPVEPVRLVVADEPEGTAVTGLPADLPEGATVVVLADALTFPAGQFVEAVGRARPDVSIVGGLAASGGTAGTRLVLDGEVYRDGAVGIVVPRDQLVGPVVSQGCRPVGEPMVVTASDREFVLELAGRPALERLSAVVAGLSADDRTLLAQGIQVGVVVDEGKDTFSRGDFLVRSVLGADRDRGVLAVGQHLPVGTTVQFQVRDAQSADEDLHATLHGLRGDGALVFTDDGRGSDLFGIDHHDATTIGDHLDTDAVAGMFCAGELGPAGGRSHLHRFTASILIFADP